jgi:hypothetical protein
MQSESFSSGKFHYAIIFVVSSGDIYKPARFFLHSDGFVGHCLSLNSRNVLVQEPDDARRVTQEDSFFILLSRH